MKAIIVGGGIGGLTAALMLRARGIACELFEQADAIRELGVGINTLPHAIRELAGLGLLQKLDDVAIRTDELYYLNRHGQEVWRESRGIDAGHDVPQFSIHRGRLQSVIHRAVEERLGPDAIYTGCRLGAFTQDEGGVNAYFFDRAGRHIKTARGDILIGADGIHSRVRETLFPGEGPPCWNGLMLWRGARDWPAIRLGTSTWGTENRATCGISSSRLPGRDQSSRRGGGALPSPTFTSTAQLVERPRHAARRRRASDVSGRVERRFPGHPRCAMSRRYARTFRTSAPGLGGL